MFNFLFLLQQIAKESAENSSWSIGLKEVLTLLGIFCSGAFGYLIARFNRSGKVEDDRNESQRREAEENRKDRNDITNQYKDEVTRIGREFDELSEKYDKLYTDNMKIQIDLAVIAYEHELLYSKLTPEDSQIIKTRVDVFRTALSKQFAKDEVTRNESKDK